MSEQELTYEELEARLAEAETVIGALRKQQVDAVVGEEHIALVHQQDAEQALRESEGRFRAIAELATDAIISADSRGNIVFWNQAAQTMFGYAEAEVLGEPLTLIMPERYRDDHRRGLQQFRSTGQTRQLAKTVELHGLRRDGREFPVELSLSTWQAGQERFFTAIVRDVTERKQAEQTLQRYANRLEALHHIDQGILAAESPEAIAQAALRHIRRLVPCLQASVVTFDSEAGQGVILASHVDGESEIQAGNRVPLDALDTPNELRDGEAHMVADTLSLSEPPAVIQKLRTEGIRSYISVPLTAEGRLIGSLYLGADRPDAFTREHVDVAHEVAASVAVALKDAQAEAELRRSASEILNLQHITEALLGPSELTQLMNTIAEGIVTHLSYDMALVTRYDEMHNAFIDLALYPPGLISRALAHLGSPKRYESLQEHSVQHTPGANPVVQRALEGQTVISDCLANLLEPWVPRATARAIQKLFGRPAYINLPMQVKEQTVGMIVAGVREGPITPDQQRALARVANQAAIAIQNARLFEQVRAGREQLQALSQRQAEVQEIERRRIARELHDEIGQMLTGLKMTLEATARQVTDDTVQASLEEAQVQLRDLAARTNELSLDLRPTVLDDLGLLPALVWLFKRYTERTDVDVDFRHSGLQGQRFPPEVETAAYRIVQEALTNVARHADVDSVSVRLWASQGILTAQVKDEGVGFDPKAALAAESSIGLIGMHERAGLLGGRLTVESSPGAGALLMAELPLDDEQLERRKGER